jgi:hypothetical protein
MMRSSLLSSIFAFLASWMPGASLQAAQPLLSVPSEPAADPAARPDPVVEPDPTPPATLGSRGATPTHYRAFSVLAVRMTDVASSKALVAFRERAKTIKLEDSQVVRDQALALLDHFALIADRYAPLHDADDDATRTRRSATMLAAIGKLDDALAAIMASAQINADGFESAVRFIDIRYDTAAGDNAVGYGLTSV